MSIVKYRVSHYVTVLDMYGDFTHLLYKTCVQIPHHFVASDFPAEKNLNNQVRH